MYMWSVVENCGLPENSKFIKDEHLFLQRQVFL